MKIIFESKSYKIVKAAILLIAVAMVAYVGYSATQLTVNNSGTVTIFHNWQGITFSPPTSQPTCSTQISYSDTPAAMIWNNIAQGSSASGYICVKNAGGAGSSFSVTTSGAPAGITVTYNGTSTLTSTTLLSTQTSLIDVVVSVALTASTGGFSYTTSIA